MAICQTRVTGWTDMSDDVYRVKTVKLQIFSLIMIKCWPMCKPLACVIFWYAIGVSAVGLHPVHSSLYNTWGKSIILTLFNNWNCNLFGLNIRLNFNRMLLFFPCVAILTWKPGNLLRNSPIFVSVFSSFSNRNVSNKTSFFWECCCFESFYRSSVSLSILLIFCDIP